MRTGAPPPTSGIRSTIDRSAEQRKLDTALAALDELAARDGNVINRASLSRDDLYFLADLPLILTHQRFDQRHLTVPDLRRLDSLLDRATGRAIIDMCGRTAR
jgi:hypothetical protein